MGTPTYAASKVRTFKRHRFVIADLVSGWQWAQYFSNSQMLIRLAIHLGALLASRLHPWVPLLVNPRTPFLTLDVA